jgi:WD domain, G-beta repeat
MSSTNIQYDVLPLDAANEDTATNENEEKPRRLGQIGTTKELFAYGGTGSDICKIVVDNNVKNADTPIQNFSSKSLHHWSNEESIRSIAISKNGQCVISANDIWEVKFLSYDNIDSNTEHPFLASSTSGKEWEFVDTFDATIRDIQFYPDSSSWVAIATEGGMGLVNLLDYTSSDIENKGKKVKYLWDQVEEHHNSCGIRCVQFHRLTADKVILASIGMDGRLCLWDVSDLSNPRSWTLLLRESGKCIPKNDVGEILDSDPWDQSCRPAFVSIQRKSNKTINTNTDKDDTNKSCDRVTVLALPGMPYLQLRRIDVIVSATDNSTRIHIEPFDQVDVSTNPDSTTLKGHIEPIVTFATMENNNSSYLISTGRDKRIVLWSLQQRKVK